MKGLIHIQLHKYETASYFFLLKQNSVASQAPAFLTENPDLLKDFKASLIKKHHDYSDLPNDHAKHLIIIYKRFFLTLQKWENNPNSSSFHLHK